MSETLDHVAEVAGYWTEGVARGLFISLVPIMVIGSAIGVALFVVKLPLKYIGGVE